MGIMPWIVMVAAVVAVALGGDFRNLVTLKIRGWWLFGAALAVKVVLLASGAPRTAYAQPLIFALVAAGALANWRLPGVRLIALGLLLNAAAVAANGGVMPYSLVSAELVGRKLDPPRVTALSVPETPESRLIWLDDRIPFPRNKDLMSIGDVAVILGAFVLVISVARPKRLPSALVPRLA